MLQAIMTRDGMTTTSTSTPTSPTTSTTLIKTASLSPLLTTTTAITKPTVTATAPVAGLYSCVSNVCTGASPAVDFAYKTLQALINFGSQKLVRLGKAAAAPLTVDGKLDQRTLNAYLPISREVGGKLAIFDFTPTPEYLARNADTFAYEIAKWTGYTWVPATATVPGHWERFRAGQTEPVLPQYTPPVAPTAALCPRGATATSVGCLYPPGTVAAFNKQRGKWRIAIPNSVLANLPAQAQPSAPTSSPTSSLTSLRPAGFGFYGFGAFGAATHTVVAEVDSPPPGVQQIDESQLETMTGEAPAPTPAPMPTAPPQPAPMPAPTPAPTMQPAPTSTPAPVQVDTTVLAPQTEASPTEGRYKGCIARFNKTRKVFSIYCPVGSKAAEPGLGIVDGEYFRCLFGNCGGLGASDVTPPPPEGFVKTAEVTTLPRAGETPAGDERDRFFRLNNPFMWVAIAGVAAAAGGGYVIYRRRRST